MEIANLWAMVKGDIKGVRTAQHDDAQFITYLLRQSAYAHLHADWHYPADWLGSPGFVVMDAPDADAGGRSLPGRLFRSHPQLLACLAVAADPLPAAWVRVAAVAKSGHSLQILAAMFAAVSEYLKDDSVKQLGWLLVESWPDEWLLDLGFEKEDYVETYVKRDIEIPVAAKVTGLAIRPVQDVDLQQLEQIEANAFEPLWRHSVTSLILARRHAISFDVAELNGTVVGYQFSTPVESGVHLARMTVDPSYQGSGIGTQLLIHACEGYRQRGVERISLNTQMNNHASRKLYRRFGFQPNGQKFPVWVVEL